MPVSIPPISPASMNIQVTIKLDCIRAFVIPITIVNIYGPYSNTLIYSCTIGCSHPHHGSWSLAANLENGKYLSQQKKIGEQLSNQLLNIVKAL